MFGVQINLIVIYYVELHQYINFIEQYNIYNVNLEYSY